MTLMPLSSEEIAWLKKHLGDECSEVLVEGDDPLLLDEPSFVYVTQVAHHQLFCVGYKDGEAVGRREHVALCRSGQLLFGLGIPPGDDPTALLLSGAAGSLVLRFPAKLVFSALTGEHGAERCALFERLFDGWIELLIATLPAAPVPTRCDTVAPGATLEAVTVPVRASEGLVWLTVPLPPTRYGGVKLGEQDGKLLVAWPLTPTTWIAFEGEGARAATSAKRATSEGTLAFADAFYAFVEMRLARLRTGIAQSRLERDVASREAERELVGDALRQLAIVGRGDRIAAELGRGVDPLEHACLQIATWLEVPPFRVPKPAQPGLGAIQTALSLVTSVRTRKVILEKTWYENDAGPLLGFAIGDGEEELHPVALLPSGSGYELHDPRGDGPERLTAELAEGLHPQAHQFYAPLPDRAIGPLDILKFSTRRARRDVAFVMLLGISLGSLSTFIPLLTAQIFDNLIPGAERGLLLQLTFVLLFVYLGESLFDIARGLATVRVQTRMDSTLEAGVWDRLLSLPLPFFREYSAGELASRAGGIAGIRAILTGATISALLGGLFSIWNFVFLFAIEPSLALAATGLVILAIIPAVLGTYFGLKRQRKVAAIDGKIEGLLLQLLSGIAKLRVTAAENRAFAVWGRLFARRRDADLGAERVNIRISIFNVIYPTLCSIVLYFMLAGGGKQKLSTGLFLAFSAAFAIFLNSTLSVMQAVLSSLAAIPLYERAKPIMHTLGESQGSGERVDLRGGIEVNHVSFRYDPKGPLILDDVSFQIRADEFVALVGPSGSGKSTLLRLLLGFEVCSSGGVFYDGQALAGLDARSLRKQIGVVMQNSRVMGGDIFSNIVGATGLTQEDAWRAARNAALDKDIETMPMAMNTVVSQGGGTLSGGQRQRLLIARALAPQPRILFFDEATSALDNVTQAIVSQSLEGLHVTRVVIAHRLSTIRHADKIVVLEKGKVVQVGRFDDLIAVEGPFQALAKRQMV
jgi:NHLM bacteriocin system ABC transporter ATP-binding protein